MVYTMGFWVNKAAKSSTVLAGVDAWQDPATVAAVATRPSEKDLVTATQSNK